MQYACRAFPGYIAQSLPHLHGKCLGGIPIINHGCLLHLVWGRGTPPKCSAEHNDIINLSYCQSMHGASCYRARAPYSFIPPLRDQAVCVHAVGHGTALPLHLSIKLSSLHRNKAILYNHSLSTFLM